MIGGEPVVAVAIGAILPRPRPTRQGMLDAAMHDDDRPVGRLLTRREALALLGAGGVAALAAGPWRPASAAAPATCIARPALTEGPYFVDAKLNRSDIRSDPGDGTARPGAPLRLTLRVSRLA